MKSGALTLLRTLASSTTASLPSVVEVSKCGTSFVNGCYSLKTSGKSNVFEKVDSSGRVFEICSVKRSEDSEAYRNLSSSFGDDGDWCLIRMIRPVEIHFYASALSSGGWHQSGGLTPIPQLSFDSVDSKSLTADDSKEVVTEDNTVTKRLYYDNTYLFEHNKGKVVSVSESEKPNEWIVVLDETIFHPQGGGQPCDKGTLTVDGSDAVFTVTRVFESKRDSSAIQIYITAENSASVSGLMPGAVVHQCVDAELRQTLAKLHSAGHLLDIALICAIDALQMDIELKPTKGYHFLKGAYVEYLGKCAPEARPKLKAEVQRICGEIVKSKIACATGFGEDCKRQVSWEFPDGDLFAAGKSAAKCNCGGTHVDTTDRFEKITIKGFKKKGKYFRVSYTAA